MAERHQLRAVFVALFALICFVQCYSIIRNYLEYPAIINIYDESPSLISIMPGITICNNNRVSLRKLMARNATIRRAMFERFHGNQIQNGRIVSMIESAKFNQFRNELFKIYAQLKHDSNEVALNLTLDESFEFKPDTYPFIEWFGCARTWKNSINCAELTRIESITSRKCTTLLHQGAMLYDATNRPEVFNSSFDEKLNSADYFDAKEVAKLVINFEPEDYGDLKRQIGARIMFHDSSFVAGLGELDYFVTRGYRYDFSIDRLDTKLLGEPHHRCQNYQKMNLNKFRLEIEPRTPLDAQTCLQNCVVRNMLSRSNCWPASQPYYRNDSFDPELKVKFCNWFREDPGDHFKELVRSDAARQHQRAMSKFGEGVESEAERRRQLRESFENGSKVLETTRNPHSREHRKIVRFCRSRCAPPCRIVEYSVTVTKTAWPPDVKTLFDKTGEVRQRRHCCALVVVKYTHFHYNIHEYQLKYLLTNIVGDVGALLAFWLGLSIVSIYHAIQKLMAFCSRRSMSKIKDLRRAARVSHANLAAHFVDEKIGAESRGAIRKGNVFERRQRMIANLQEKLGRCNAPI